MLFRYVTSMSRKQFDQYGRVMLETWLQYWPEGEMFLYSEDTLPIEHPRIVLKDLWAIDGLKDFNQSLSRFPACHGKIGGKYNYRFNVEAFSKKAFAQCDASLSFKGYLFWLDADVSTHKSVPRAVLEEMLRGRFMCVMKRKHWHLCSSFVGWDCAHAFSADWWNAYFSTYVTGNVLTLPQWDDAFVLDVLTKDALGIRDLASHVDKPGPHNVFDDVFKGYAHHAKGNLKYGPQRYKIIRQMVEQLKPEKILEVGTWNGGRAVEMCKGTGAQYIGFDLFEDANEETDALEKNVKPHHAMNAVSAKLTEASIPHTLFRGNSRLTLPQYKGTADFAFIDGGHSVETIREDFDNVRKIVGNGVILLDDYYSDMPDDYLKAFGAQEILKDYPHQVVDTKDPVQGGGYTQIAIVVVENGEPVEFMVKAA